MAEIYQQAYTVIVWLGRADESSDTVVDYLNETGHEAQAYGMENDRRVQRQIWQDMALESTTNNCQNAEDITVEKFDESTVSRKRLHKLFNSLSGWSDQDKLVSVAGVKALFTRPWWGRIWVLQEVTVSKNTIFVAARASLYAGAAHLSVRTPLCGKSSLLWHSREALDV